MLVIHIAVLAAVLASSPGLSEKERLYQHACYTGVAAAQEVLPKVSQEDELMDRGFASCDGSIVRLRKTAELEREKDVPGFACGYAVGSMFAKYGLGHEVEAGSPRAEKAMGLCVERLRKQGVAK